MVVRIRKIFAVMACALILLACSYANAGILAVHPSAYNNGSGPAAGAWRGTTSFTNGALTGSIDWAVFTAASFNIDFAGGGYTAPAGQLVYTHQVFSTGANIGVSQMDITLAGFPAGNAGSFAAGGVSGVDVALGGAISTPTLASFTLVGETNLLTPSDGLVYASPNPPQLTGIPGVIDGGTSAQAILPIGIPGVPEPSTMLIAGVASGLLALIRVRRRN
jgi:hypothetical protein